MEVEMDVVGVHHHHHQQEISSETLESILVCTKPQEDKKPRPLEEALKCPRCDSINTKFCYYNNYSLTQPRYFCKSCRRYWTKGGTLRNVPVGGGCRKNKRQQSSSSTTSSLSSCATSSNSPSCSALSKIRGPQDHHHMIHQQHQLSLITPNSNSHLLSGLTHLPYDSNCTDLSLAFARLQNQANGSMGYDHFDHNDHHLGTNGDPLGFLENTHNMLYNGGNLGNGDMGSVGNMIGLNNVSSDHDQHQKQQILSPMFHDHQDQELISCREARLTTGVTATPMKQEACNMMRSSEVGLWGFPWQMGAGGAEPGTMAHEVESGRSMIGGWNGLGSTNWHGLINSPLM